MITAALINRIGLPLKGYYKGAIRVEPSFLRLLPVFMCFVCVCEEFMQGV